MKKCRKLNRWLERNNMKKKMIGKKQMKKKTLFWLMLEQAFSQRSVRVSFGRCIFLIWDTLISIFCVCIMQWYEKDLDTQFAPNVYCLDTQFWNPGWSPVLEDLYLSSNIHFIDLLSVWFQWITGGNTEANQYNQAEDGKTELSLMHFTVSNSRLP